MDQVASILLVLELLPLSGYVALVEGEQFDTGDSDQTADLHRKGRVKICFQKSRCSVEYTLMTENRLLINKLFDSNFLI